MLRKRLVTGIDIGSHSIKCSVADADLGRIHSLWEKEILPGRKFRYDRIEGKSFEERLVGLLGACRKECPGFGGRAITAIQGEPTISRYFELPFLTEKQMEMAVVSEGISHIPFPVEEITVSHTLVPPLSGDQKKTGVFFVAARKSSVEKLRKLMERCSLELERIELPALALTREFAANQRVATGEFFLLMHVGFRLTHLVVVQNRYPYFATDFPLAGRDFIYALQMGKQSSWEEANSSILGYDLKKKDPFFQPFLQTWLNEIRQFVDFFRSSPNGRPLSPAKIFLSGGMAEMNGLSGELSEMLKVPVELSGWTNLRIQETRPVRPSAFKIAAGLSLER